MTPDRRPPRKGVTRLCCPWCGWAFDRVPTNLTGDRTHVTPEHGEDGTGQPCQGAGMTGAPVHEGRPSLRDKQREILRTEDEP